MSDDTKQEQSDHGGTPNRPTGRKLAEWVTLSVSVVLVVGVAGFLLYGAMREHPPFVPVEVRVRVEEAKESQGRHVTPVEVRNGGARTIKDVTVEVTHRSADGAEQTAELVIDYLAERATERAYVVFDSDPRELKVEARAIHYQLD